MNPRLGRPLASGGKRLREITQGEFAEDRSAIDSVMRTFFELGTALGREPGLATNDAVSSFLREAQVRIDRLLLALGSYVLDTEHLLGSAWEDDEWLRVSRRRSAIEFLKTLLSAPPDDEALDTADMDEQIRERGKTESIVPPGGVDPGIPRSHW